MKTSWKYRFFLAPDDGGTGAGTEAPADATVGAGQDTAPQNPAYFSQFRKENRERFASLSKYKSLDELAEAAIKGDNVQEPDYSGYVKMPTGESTKEEIKDFLTKLGVPDGPDKYNMPMEEDAPQTVTTLNEALREIAYKAGLTDKQAEKMWGFFHALTDTALMKTEAYRRDQRENFGKRYEKLFENDYPDKAQRDAAIKESLGYFNTLMQETGLREAFEKDGTLYNEHAVRALANYQKRNRGAFNHGSTAPKAPSQSTRLHYSDDFEKQFGGKGRK